MQKKAPTPGHRFAHCNFLYLSALLSSARLNQTWTQEISDA